MRINGWFLPINISKMGKIFQFNDERWLVIYLFLYKRLSWFISCKKNHAENLFFFFAWMKRRVDEPSLIEPNKSARREKMKNYLRLKSPLILCVKNALFYPCFMHEKKRVSNTQGYYNQMLKMRVKLEK